MRKSKSKAFASEATPVTATEADLAGAERDSYSAPLMEQLAKAFGQTPFPGVDTAAILETIIKNMTALGTANKHIFENAQAVMVRQGEILSKNLQEASAALDAIASAGNPQEVVARQGDLLRSILLRTLKDMRQEAKTTLKASNEAFAEAFTTINARVITNVRELTELIERLEKS